MLKFKIAEHVVRSGDKLVEVWQEKRKVAEILITDKGIKIKSVHFISKEKIREAIEIDATETVPTILINLI